MKVRRNVRSVIAAATSLSVLTASLAVSDMSASAADNQLNIKVYMDEMMCWNYSSICDETTLGTYGMPTSFTTRLGYITGFSRGYYGYRGINIVFSEFSPSDHLRETPATLCVDASDDWAATMRNGCSCVSVSTCKGGTYHCNNVERFVEELPSYNADETAVLLLTTSRMCSNGGGEHHYVNGLTSIDSMWVLSRDTDYYRSHSEEENNPYTYARMITAHEIGHLFNVRDHYNNTTVLPTLDPDCIWGINMYNYDVANSGYACAVCDGTIRDNVNLYNHPKEDES